MLNIKVDAKKINHGTSFGCVFVHLQVLPPVGGGGGGDVAAVTGPGGKFHPLHAARFYSNKTDKFAREKTNKQTNAQRVNVSSVRATTYPNMPECGC